VDRGADGGYRRGISPKKARDFPAVSGARQHAPSCFRSTGNIRGNHPDARKILVTFRPLPTLFDRSLSLGPAAAAPTMPCREVVARRARVRGQESVHAVSTGGLSHD